MITSATFISRFLTLVFARCLVEATALCIFDCFVPKHACVQTSAIPTALYRMLREYTQQSCLCAPDAAPLPCLVFLRWLLVKEGIRSVHGESGGVSSLNPVSTFRTPLVFIGISLVECTAGHRKRPECLFHVCKRVALALSSRRDVSCPEVQETLCICDGSVVIIGSILIGHLTDRCKNQSRLDHPYVGVWLPLPIRNCVERERFAVANSLCRPSCLKRTCPKSQPVSNWFHFP